MSLVFQKYNADYDLSAKEGADTLAFVSLLEEKLLPALVRRELQKTIRAFSHPACLKHLFRNLAGFLP